MSDALKPRIAETKSSSAIRHPYLGHFYICRGEGDETMYLHPDGAWTGSTTRDGEHSGYYSTREEAEQVLERFS